MSYNREINLDKPSKYVREDNPEHSALAEEIERKHVAITASKHIVLKGHPLVVQPGVFSPEFSLIGDLLVETMDIQSEDGYSICHSPCNNHPRIPNLYGEST